MLGADMYHCSPEAQLQTVYWCIFHSFQISLGVALCVFVG